MINYVVIKMGNNISNPTNVENQSCFICNDKIGNQKWCKCVRCHIILHNNCEKKDRGERNFCKCPNSKCKIRIGSIGCNYDELDDL